MASRLAAIERTPARIRAGLPLRLARIRIAFVSHVFWPEKRRGGERLIRDLADVLVARGHEPTLVTSHKSARSVATEDGLRVIRQRRWPERPFNALGLPPGSSHAPAAWAALRRSDAEVVQAWTIPAALAAARSGKPSVFVFQGVLAEADLAGRPRVRKLLERAARECDVVTAYSELAAAEFTRIVGVEARAIEPGIRLDAFTPAGDVLPGPAPSSRSAAPAVFCAADPDEPRKRVGLLVDAFAQVRRQRPDAQLWLMGPADAFATTDGVRIVDPGDDRDALVNLYRSAWVTVLPAFREAFGLVVVESLACGTPVIGMSDGGAVPRLISAPARDGSAAIAEPTSRALADALLAALAAPPDATAAVACRTRAERFSIDRCADRYLELYRQLI